MESTVASGLSLVLPPRPLCVPAFTLRSLPRQLPPLHTRSYRRRQNVALSCTPTDVESTLEDLQPVVVDAYKAPKPSPWEHLRGDMFGGLTAAVVALPLALAFGVASGAGPSAGLYGATFAGFLAALFGGTPTQITGPTGPMTVVAAGMFASFGAHPRVAFTVIFLSRAVQALPSLLSNMNVQACIIGAVSFALCTFTPKRITKIMPGSLLALAASTTIAATTKWSVPMLGHIPSQLPMPIGLSFPTTLLPMMMKSALILAVLGTIDSLLTSLVADNLTDTYHDSDKEMVGQGIGNAVAGLFGGIPSAGATMRTVVNIRSGGKTRLSGMFHSVLLLFILVGGGSMAKNIPLAALAGILMKTGWDIIDKQFIARLMKLPPATGIVMWTVLLTTVFVDLIVAVGAGCVLASLLLVNEMAKIEVNKCSIITAKEVEAGHILSDLSQLEKSLIESGEGTLGLVRIHGSFTFSAANGILRKVVPAMIPLKSVILDLTSVTLMDGDAVLAIEQLAKKATAEGKLFLVSGASQEICLLMERIGLNNTLPLDASFDRVKCLYVALKETCNIDLPSEHDPNSNNAVNLRGTIWAPPITLPLTSDTEDPPPA